MWTSLALLSALTWTPAQAGQLQLKNARFTNGIFGQERKSTTFLPGDMVVLAFDVEGLKIKEDGQVQYSMSMELYNHKTKMPEFKKTPVPMSVINTLGGSRLPMFGLTNIGTDTEAGDFTVTVVVTDTSDASGKTTAKLERKFEVKKKEFGFVRTGFVYNKLNDDDSGPVTTMAPPVAVPGQNLMLHFMLVGFTMMENKDKPGDKPQPNLTVTMTVQDEAGKPVLGKAFSGTATTLDDEEYRKANLIPFKVPIQVNRGGKFKLVLTAKDEHSGKTVTQTLDLRVVEVN